MFRLAVLKTERSMQVLPPKNVQVIRGRRLRRRQALGRTSFSGALTAPADAITLEHESLVAVKWAAADEWWEEDERVFGEHPRDARHRVDVRQSSRHVVVAWQGTVIADSHRPMLLAETDLPLRYYLPRADVRFELLRRGELTTWCPYKGLASYYDIAVGEARRPGALWTYEAPLVDTPPGLVGLIGIWHEKLTVTVDGLAA